jgi:hypothetical protein
VGRLERQHGCRPHGYRFGGTPLGQRIDVIELDEEGTAVVDVTEMTLPMESARFRSLVLGPDGALYAAVDEGMIHKLEPAGAGSGGATDAGADPEADAGADTNTGEGAGTDGGADTGSDASTDASGG